MRIETRAVHAGRSVDPATGAVVSAIHPSTTFERDVDGGYARGHLYARNSNPNRDALEHCLADLEGGLAAAAFGSGTAATMAVFQALAPGDHVIAPHDLYSGTARFLADHMARWGLDATFVDVMRPDEVQAALRPTTRLVWIETPSNPMLRVTDIARVAAVARAAGAVSVCDNTIATPILQLPLALGADLVHHATTKYLSGHSDVMGGAIVARSVGGIFERIRKFQASGGAIPSPFDCWLVLRSIRSLPYRVRAHSDHALRVAQFLAEHDRVTAVHYPGLPHHPGYDVAARQMRGCGGVLSVEIEGGRDAAMKVAARGRLFTPGPSHGGGGSYIQHPAAVEGGGARTPEGVVRLRPRPGEPGDQVRELGRGS